MLIIVITKMNLCGLPKNEENGSIGYYREGVPSWADTTKGHLEPVQALR